MTSEALGLYGFLAGIGIVPLVVLLLRLVHVEVEDGYAVLVTRFGRLAHDLRRPGWHWLADRVMPWVKLHRVSLQRDFCNIQNVCINDVRGTTVIVDVFVEYRIVDPAKATFAVDAWDRALTNLVSHSVISILGNRDFQQILTDRTELAGLLQSDIASETARWGIQVELVFIRNVSLLPEVSQQIFGSIAARLERAKASVEENGRQRIALLDAETSSRIANLLATAKGQYPAAVGRAYQRLEQNPEIRQAYTELYELSIVRPHRTVAFLGFSSTDLRAVDAAMLMPLHGDIAANTSPPPASGEISQIPGVLLYPHYTNEDGAGS